eukprot:c21980_g1_i1 orf=88-1746(-)
MTETIEKGNLIFKIEVFLNSSILRSWKDSIFTLQSAKALFPWSEDLEIVNRCIESIASKASVDPSKVDWAFTYAQAGPSSGQQVLDSSSPPWNGIQSRRCAVVPKDWWVEDICELEIDLYWRVMVAIKSIGRMSPDLIGEALRVFTYKWLPEFSKDHTLLETLHGGFGTLSGDFAEKAGKYKLLLETIVNLLPIEKGSSSCSFLLKLLKSAALLGSAHSAKIDLARRVGLQLDEALLTDLLIPSLSHIHDSLYDVELVQNIVEHFMMQDQSPPLSPSRVERSYERRKTHSAEHLDLMESRRSTSATHSSKLRVAKLIDGYLAEIAHDTYLPMVKFIALAESIPDFARPVHDGLYRAIDIYLKEHPGLTKNERKKLCRLMDCKKLSMDACMHAAQNERLPLRVVVQVLFYEQVRLAMAGGFLLNDLPSNVREILPQKDSAVKSVKTVRSEDEWEAVHNDFTVLKGDLADMKLRLAEAERDKTNMRQEVVKHSKPKGLCFLPSTPKLFFGKIWPIKIHSGARNSETLRSCGSPHSTNQLEQKPNASRRRRHSIS